jgi:hypothetical protein
VLNKRQRAITFCSHSAARHECIDSVPYSAIPKQGAIVQRSGRGCATIRIGLDWTPAASFELPDYDVFVIDTTSDSPKVVDQISNVGSVLFNMAVQPGSGEIWVSNTEAFNFDATRRC